MTGSDRWRFPLEEKWGGGRDVSGCYHGRILREKEALDEVREMWDGEFGDSELLQEMR